jgi:hypothetical protein
MARPLRHMLRRYSLFEVSIRTVQERFLLRPSAELNDLILGVLGRALLLYPSIRIYSFKFLSNHFHIILAAPDIRTLALFMNHIDSNIAREAGRLHGWHDKFWSRRYRPVSIEDDAKLVEKTKYVLAQGCKESLVAHPLDWPGASSDRALLFGEKLEGTWYDRAAFYEAERSGKQVRLQDFAVRYEVPLTTLPILEGKSEEEQCAFYQGLVDEIGQETYQACIDQDKQVLGVAAVLNQDPHDRPRTSKRSPAPLCHSSTKEGRLRYRRAYRKFVALYRQAVERLRQGDASVKFPENCFLPPILCPPHLVEVAAPG